MRESGDGGGLWKGKDERKKNGKIKTDRITKMEIMDKKIKGAKNKEKQANNNNNSKDTKRNESDDK